MDKRLRRVVVAVACCTILAAMPTVARAEDDYRAADVFSDINRASLESQCGDARRYAQIFAEKIREVDLPTARKAEDAFLSCANIKRLNPNPDNVRFPILAAAAAAFAEAMLSTGEDRAESLRRAYKWVNAILPYESDHTTLASTGQFPRSKIVHITGTVHDPSQHAQPLRFTEIALRLRAAIEGEYDL